MRQHHWSHDTHGLVAFYASAGLAIFLLRDIWRLGNRADNYLTGSDAEEAVAAQLDPLRQEGWTVVHNVLRDDGRGNAEAVEVALELRRERRLDLDQLFGERVREGEATGMEELALQVELAAIADELGLVGAFALLSLALLLVFRGLRIAMLAHDDFSSMLGVGLTISLGLQTLIIVAGNAKLIPLTGITFPFVSYGGSSLLASFIVIGLLLSVSHRSARGAQVQSRP